MNLGELVWKKERVCVGSEKAGARGSGRERGRRGMRFTATKLPRAEFLRRHAAPWLRRRTATANMPKFSLNTLTKT